jgi:hypothetical protein
MSGISVFFATGSYGSYTNGTSWPEILCGGTGLSDPAAYTTLESQRQYEVQTPGVFSGMYINVTTYSGSSAVAVTFRNNSANGNESLSISTVKEYTDTTHTDAVSVTNLVNWQSVTASGVSAAGNVMGQVFTPSSGILMQWLVDGANASLPAANTYSSIAGQIAGTGSAPTQASCQWKSQIAGKCKNLNANINTFASSPSATITFQIAGSNGNESLSPAALGQVADTTHTDSVSVNSLINTLTACSTTLSNFGTTFIQVDWAPNALQVSYISGWGLAAIAAFAANTNNYLCLATRLRYSTTETQASCPTQTGFTSFALQAYSTANSITGNTVMSLRKAAANGNQSITFGSGVTLWQTDLTHTDYVTAATELDMLLAVPNSGTSITITQAGFSGTYGPPGVPVVV